MKRVVFERFKEDIEKNVLQPSVDALAFFTEVVQWFSQRFVQRYAEALCRHELELVVVRVHLHGADIGDTVDTF